MCLEFMGVHISLLENYNSSSSWPNSGLLGSLSYGNESVAPKQVKK